LGFIIGFSAISLIFTSNLMINSQNFTIAYPVVNKVSFVELNKFSTIPVKDTPGNSGRSFISTNPNNEEWKNRVCENTNQAGIKIRIPLMCDSSDNTEQNRNSNQHNQDISDRLNETVGNLKEKLDDSIFGNEENDNSQSNDLQSDSKGDDNKNGKDNNNDGTDNNNQNGDDNEDGNNDKNNKFSEQQLLDQQGEDKAKSELDDDNTDRNNGNNQRNNNNGNNGNNGNDQENNSDDGLGIAGLDLGLNIDEKLGDVDKKIDNLKNNLGVGQQQENKDNEKNNNDKGNDDGTLGINGLAPNVKNIQANLEKQIEKLKDRFENERDNQRLIEQRNEFDDDDDDDADDGDDDSDDGDGKDYDGYGFKGDDDDNGNGNGPENGEENFNFAAAGDFGCSTNTQNTIENMQSKDPEIVLTLGDHSYHSTADCWFDMMSPVKNKLMLTLGYHDVEDGQAKMNQYMNSFAMDKPFYSYDYNKVHFLVISAKSVYYKGSEQYNFVVEDLKKASENENVNWIVVSSYGPPYTSPSEHTAFKELREAYHPIFEQYGVDLVLGGHNHNYQRTYPLTYNPDDSGEPKVTNTATTEYDAQKDGIVFAIVGTGGVNLYPFTGQAPFVEKQFANKFGFLNIDISNGNPDTKLTGTFYDNKGGQILDQFTIEKDLKNKNTEVINS
jgi:hypothetical protein